MKTLSPSLHLVRLTSIMAVLTMACLSQAQVTIFTENFETDHSLDNTWITNTIGGYNPVDLYFNYATVGIPSAPNSTGGTTRGLKLQANLDPLVQVFPSGSSVSPAGFGISANFEMRWDWWLNFNGSPVTGLIGGIGATQIGGAGFGTAATSANVPTAIDCIFIGCSGDGTGTAADYRVYSPAFSASLQDVSGVYAAGAFAGSRNNSDVYYQATFPPVTSTNTCPNQLALYPTTQFGFTQGGSAGMKWHDISLKKVGNIITYSIDSLLIATLDISTNGTMGGANIVFGQFDINAGASTDISATNLAFSLVDNIRITSFTNVVTVSAPTPAAAEASSSPGTFTITRTGSGTPLTVFYKMSGTASNGLDYTNALGGALSGSVTFSALATETNITIVPIDDAISETTETAILTLLGGDYVASGGATVNIADNDPQVLTLTNISTQMYERTNDYATFRVTRLGDLNVAQYFANISFAGTAANGSDYYPDATVSIDNGLQSVDVKVYPIEDSAYEGNETITMSLAAAGGGEYAIGSPASGAITLVDATTPPATVLFSEDFSFADTATNWNKFIGGNGDHSVIFADDYSARGIPPAPHGSGDTLGLYMAVNKATGSATAINLYPRDQNFSGNYALRFDMFISVEIPNAVATEYVLFGVNHSGTKTNWFRSDAGGVPAGWTFDGVFYSIDVAGDGLVAGNVAGGDYVNYSSPTTTGNNPTLLNAGRRGTTLSNVYKSPPSPVPGIPANNTVLVSPNPMWADVEVSQIGKTLTWKINNTTIFAYSNTTAYAAGNIMIGYDDALFTQSLNSSFVIFDNVRVVRLDGLKITSIVNSGANVLIDFTLDLNDTASAFKVQSSTTVNTGYADATATIVQLTPGSYRATVAKSGNTRYYRVLRN